MKKVDLPADQIVLLEYHEYLDVFDEEKANRFPNPRPWDHKIKMKPGFKPKSFKTYNLTPEEQTRLMREGRCFKCKKVGHMALNCPPGEIPKKWDSKGAAAHIRALIAGMNPDEKEKLMKDAEEEGLGFY